MDHKQSLNEIGKYVAQAKDLIERYLNLNDEDDQQHLREALIILKNALEHVIV